MDDGRLTDNKGRTVNFKNTIVIMTSNIGSHIIQENYDKLTELNKEEVLAKAKSQVFELLKLSIRPEFLNRIDEVIMFEPLTRDNVHQIVEIQLKHVISMLKDQGYEMTYTEHGVDWLSQLGYDPQFGARPVKRVIQRSVLNELSKQILSGAIKKDKKIILDSFDNKIVFRNE